MMSTVSLPSTNYVSMTPHAQDFTPEDQFDNDLQELQTMLNNFSDQQWDVSDPNVQDVAHSFMQQFAKDFNQLPENERKSPQMDILIRGLNKAGLIEGDTSGIQVTSYSYFTSALEKLVSSSGSSSDYIKNYIDPSIKAAEAALKTN